MGHQACGAVFLVINLSGVIMAMKYFSNIIFVLLNFYNASTGSEFFNYRLEQPKVTKADNYSLSSSNVEKYYLFHAKKVDGFDNLENKLQYIELEISRPEIRCLLKLSLVEDNGFNDKILQTKTFNTDLLSIKRVELKGTINSGLAEVFLRKGDIEKSKKYANDSYQLINLTFFPKNNISYSWIYILSKVFMNLGYEDKAYFLSELLEGEDRKELIRQLDNIFNQRDQSN